MLRRTLNLGILAHVDAGKTTLTERLLYAAGVIDAPGSVDAGTTQTDSLALERQRGITIKSAVVSFTIGDVTVNLIDTPGHPDFIAEVERVLGVLDGAVLVISAVEGVQPQTRLLMRALQRLARSDASVREQDRPHRRGRRARPARDRGPADAGGGRDGLGDGARHTSGRVRAVGPDDAAFRTRLVEALAERDEAILAAFVEDDAGVPYERLRAALVEQTGRALVHPVFFGSAMTGAGVDAVTDGIAELLPASVGDADGPVSGRVFKVERAPAGEKIAYVRVFSGTVRTRDRVRFGREGEGKVTSVAVFDQRLGRAARVGRRRGDRKALGARARSRSAMRSATSTRRPSTTASHRRRSRRSSSPDTTTIAPGSGSHSHSSRSRTRSSTSARTTSATSSRSRSTARCRRR